MSRFRMPSGRRGRIALALAGAILAAIALGLSPVLAGNKKLSDAEQISKLEGQHTLASHGQTLQGIQADRRQARLCRDPTYRLKNYVTCGGLAGKAKRADQARQRACAQRRYAAANPRRCPEFVGAVNSRLKRSFAASDTGAWTGRFQQNGLNINAILLPTGKVLWFAYPFNPNLPPVGPTYADRKTVDWAEAYVFDPATGQSVRRDPPPDPNNGNRPYDIWCAGQTLLRDGRVLVAGGNWDFAGNPQAGANFSGHNVLLTFNPFSETWTVQPDMVDGRWYPTTTLLPDGRVLIMSGLGYNGQVNDEVEIFTPSPDLNGVGTVTTLPALYRDPVIYPHLFLIPGGKVLLAGPGNFNTHVAVLDVNNPDASTWRWSDKPTFDQRREWGSATLLPAGPEGPQQILLAGGSDTNAPNYDNAPATATTQIASIPELVAWTPGRPNPWRAGPPMVQSRSHLNTTILPDGSLFTNGGGRGSGGGLGLFGDPKKTGELLLPGASSWIETPAQVDARTYHSTSLLLPDGRVISSGDDRAEHTGSLAGRTYEYYSPPYLYRGARPSNLRTPGQAPYGVQMGVTTPDTISKVAIMKLGATTHALDVDQRLLQLPFTQVPKGVTVTLPSDPSAAPPGYYQLFLLNAAGVPSVGAMIRIDAGLPAPSPVPLDPGAPDPGTPPAAFPAPKLKGVKAKVRYTRTKAIVTLSVKASSAFAGRAKLLQARKALVTVRVKGKKVKRLRTVYRTQVNRSIAGAGNRWIVSKQQFSLRRKRFPLRLRLQLTLADRRGGPSRVIIRGLRLTKNGKKGTAKILARG